MAGEDNKKECFVIAPIGEEGDPTRERSDKVLEHVITPAVESCGYTPLRADKISESGMITSQIIQHLADAPLVVADLTDHNPNVFYELAVRHVTRKPVVHIIADGQPKPFDVIGMRIIALDYCDIASAAACKEEIAQQVQAAELNPSKAENPISQAIDLQTLRGSEKPWEKSTAEILSQLANIQAVLDRLRRASLGAERVDPLSLRRLREAFGALNACLTLESGQRPTKGQFKEAQRILRQARAAIRPNAPIRERKVSEYQWQPVPHQPTPPSWIWPEDSVEK